MTEDKEVRLGNSRFYDEAIKFLLKEIAGLNEIVHKKDKDIRLY